MEARREVDWVAKQAVLEGYQERDGLAWSDPRLRAVDIQWSDVRADRGLAHRMHAAGRFEVLVSDEEVARAVVDPPEDTRAWFRGMCLRRFPQEVVAASWDSVIFDLPGARSLQRIPMLEPLRGTKASVGELVESAPDAATLLAALAAPDRR
jgi:proteasome accessory factor A